MRRFQLHLPGDRMAVLARCLVLASYRQRVLRPKIRSPWGTVTVGSSGHLADPHSLVLRPSGLVALPELLVSAHTTSSSGYQRGAYTGRTLTVRAAWPNEQGRLSVSWRRMLPATQEQSAAELHRRKRAGAWLSSFRIGTLSSLVPAKTGQSSLRCVARVHRELMAALGPHFVLVAHRFPTPRRCCRCR